MSSVYVRYVLPPLVIAGCAVLSFVARRRRGRNQVVLERSNRIVESSHAPAPTDPASEQAWRRLHGRVMDGWISAHEDLLDRASEDDFSGAEAALDNADDATLDHLATVVAAHPNPRRRAELSAMRAAAASTLIALAGADYERARRHHLVYCEYRDLWRRHAAAGDAPGDS